MNENKVFWIASPCFRRDRNDEPPIRLCEELLLRSNPEILSSLLTSPLFGGGLLAKTTLVMGCYFVVAPLVRSSQKEKSCNFINSLYIKLSGCYFFMKRLFYAIKVKF